MTYKLIFIFMLVYINIRVCRSPTFRLQIQKIVLYKVTKYWRTKAFESV